MVTTAELIAEAIDAEIPSGAMPGVDCMSGETCLTIPRKDIFDGTFNKHEYLNAPNSDRVSWQVAAALKYKWERMSCFMVGDGQFIRITKKECRDNVVYGENPFAGAWAGYMTTSYKKHGLYVSPANQPGKRGLWGFDDMTIDCSNEDKINFIYSKLLDLKKRGISQSELEILELFSKSINIVSLREWINFKEEMKQYFITPLYKFLLYLLPSREELK